MCFRKLRDLDNVSAPMVECSKQIMNAGSQGKAGSRVPGLHGEDLKVLLKFLWSQAPFTEAKETLFFFLICFCFSGI